MKIIHKINEQLIVSRINEDPGLVRAAEEACNNVKITDDVNYLEEELAKRNENHETFKKYLRNGITKYHVNNSGRRYSRRVGNLIEVVGKSDKRVKELELYNQWT